MTITTRAATTERKPYLRRNFKPTEVHVQTLVSSTIFAKALAAKIFKVYPPALFVRRVGRKVMLSACRSRTGPRNPIRGDNLFTRVGGRQDKVAIETKHKALLVLKESA